MAKRILVVDDDEGYLHAVGMLLGAEGYEVSTATDAAAAREQIKSDRPDLIMLDVIMPGEDGFAFAEELETDGTASDIPLVLVTAVAENPGEMMRAFSEDKARTAQEVLPKSMVHEQLLVAVRGALK